MIPRCLLLAALLPAAAAEFALEARDTIAGLELDPADTVRFRLRNGQTRHLAFQTARARIVVGCATAELAASQTHEKTFLSTRPTVTAQPS